MTEWIGLLSFCILHPAHMVVIRAGGFGFFCGLTGVTRCNYWVCSTGQAAQVPGPGLAWLGSDMALLRRTNESLGPGCGFVFSACLLLFFFIFVRPFLLSAVSASFG